MKAYVITTGVLFGLLVVAHVGRVLAEGTRVARDPWFAGFTVLALAMCGWAWRVLRTASRPDGDRPPV